MKPRDLIATILATLLLAAIAYGVGYYHGKASVTCEPCTATIGELKAVEATARAYADSLAQSEALAAHFRDLYTDRIQSIPSTQTRLSNARRKINLEGVPAIERALMAEPHDLRTVLDSLSR